MWFGVLPGFLVPRWLIELCGGALDLLLLVGRIIVFRVPINLGGFAVGEKCAIVRAEYPGFGAARRLRTKQIAIQRNDESNFRQRPIHAQALIKAGYVDRFAALNQVFNLAAKLAQPLRQERFGLLGHRIGYSLVEQ